MADSNKASSNGSKGKKRKYLPHGKPVRKGLYPLRPGVQGFFLTCDGGRERQAANEALNLLETFYEELVHGKESDAKSSAVPSKPLNTKIKFSDSDSSSDEEDDPHVEEPTACPQDQGDLQTRKDKEDAPALLHDGEELEVSELANEREDLPSKKQRVDADAPKVDNMENSKPEDKPIDELIEEELKELGDRNKDNQLANENQRHQHLLARRQSILQHRKSLPIASVESQLVEEIRKNDTLIIVGETGSGKTTQLPQFLYNGGFCRDGKTIAISQPRRVAAVTVAKRVAEECNIKLGQMVGYSIRFEDVTSSSTRIKYMTDGLLLREAQLDPFLSRYSVIIIDEAHERTVHTDVLLGLMKKVQLARSHATNKENNLSKEADDGLAKSGNFSLKPCQNAKLNSLKLIIMSASLDARCFSEYFGGAKAIHIHGRQYPVEVLYTYQPEPDYLDATLITIFQIHLEETAGDILAFLTGQEEIESVERLIHEHIKQLPNGSQNLLVVPIYASLPSEQQMNAFKPAPFGFRKVILATNIAETSVTIPGIKYVIDPGLVKARSYNPVTGMESLIIIPTSKAQALQRSGRAGREGSGKCFRLYPESEFGKLADCTVPEIKRCNLSNVVLQLKAFGIDDIVGFDFMEKPSRMTIVKSLEQLFLLGALTDDYKLSTPVGHQMAKLPLDPMYSKALILAAEFKCLEEMLIVVAMLSVESIFYFPREKLEEARAAIKSFSSPEGDHISMLNVYRASAEAWRRTKLQMSKRKHWIKS